MKKQKIVSVLLSLCMLLGLLLLPAQTVGATEGNAAVQEARNGVVQVAVNVLVDKKEVGFLTVGSGFLVGTSENAQTVITNYHVVHSVTTDFIKELLDLESDKKIELVAQIVVRRDLRIDAEVYKESEVGDFSILKLEQPIYDRVPLALGDSDVVQTTEAVYALGFPGIVQQIQTDSKYTFDDVNVTEGIVSKVSDVAIVSNPIPTITHSARVSAGNSGGPLVNTNGAVVGVNTFISNDENGNNDYFYATQINEIRSSLDALGVEYIKSEESGQPVSPEDIEPTDTPEPTAEPTVTDEPDNTLLFDRLGALIKEAGDRDLENVTDESAINFSSALSSAKQVWDETTSTEEQLNTAINDLQKAIDGLVEKEPGLSPTMIIIIAAAAIVVVIIIIVVVVVASGKKKKAAERERKARELAKAYNDPPYNPGADSAGASGQSSGWNDPWNQQGYGTVPMGSDGSAETGILNDGGSETTVLGGQNIPAAYLIRRKNNEQITISKAVFKIGRERRKVDYCVSDNTNVSRTHADIVYKNGAFYIVDNHAANGTTVNGSSVASGQEKMLNGNDVIRLADEEFQFITY